MHIYTSKHIYKHSHTNIYLKKRSRTICVTPSTMPTHCQPYTRQMEAQSTQTPKNRQAVRAQDLHPLGKGCGERKVGIRASQSCGTRMIQEL